MRRIVLALVLFGMLGAGGLLVSAALDEPSREYRHAVVVEAPRAAIWALLTQFDRYHEWNPYITQASGTAAVGSTVELTFRVEGGDARTEDAKILILRPQRKLEWRTRVVAPGILEREQIFRVIPLEDGRWAVVQDVRFEGLFAPFADVDDDRTGLADMLDAIVELAPSYQSSPP